MNKSWQPYARHILDAIDRIKVIQTRGDLVHDQVLEECIRAMLTVEQ